MQETIDDVLKEHALFSDLYPLEDSFSTQMKIRNFAKDDIIYRPGIDVRYAYLIVDGAIRFEFSASSGQQVFVEVVDNGFLIGELELLSGIEYHSTAVANQASRLLLIPGDVLNALIYQKPDFAIKFTRQLATNFYFFQIISAEREASNLKSRLANMLVSMCLRFGEKKQGNIGIAISNEQLSEMLNASRQRVNMQLKQWQKDGLLQCGYGKIVIMDIDQFTEESGFSNSTMLENEVRPYS